MARNSSYNILMYSHDTYGLGHIRRTMAIAGHLSGKNINILILTGSPLAGRFNFPEGVDFVRIPGMIKKSNDEYQSLSIRIDARQALDIRKRIISATAKAFRPNLFIVDKEPLGLRNEVRPTLEWMRGCLPRTRTILGLRDILDDAATVRRDWFGNGIYGVLEDLYSEIWVYGVQELYDPVAEYAIPEPVSQRVHFTGYIPRQTAGRSAIQRARGEHLSSGRNKLVVVTVGGGGDGFPVMDTFLSALEQSNAPPPFQSVLVSGPFMPEEERKNIQARARRLGIRFYRFHRRMECLIAAADLVVSMGGYNTSCEILSQNAAALLIPRESPRREQLIRAEILGRHALVDYLPWSALSPARLRQKIDRLLGCSQRLKEAMARFPLTGLEWMRLRLLELQDLRRQPLPRADSRTSPAKPLLRVLQNR